ncbi:hypothetical protein GCM10009630_00640 [Kribbella jejuensis]|uniref:Uncharacterized protein n=1 Tax=Kribbella jejuensis TaxID=236068 RepID=A0A542E8F5_9ACTN|nr:hypothetical protein [Kribbella jejuensis]TQJ11620.1 hypothetical protein FB475_4540 [Kribbella jejuensis]
MAYARGFAVLAWAVGLLILAPSGADAVPNNAVVVLGVGGLQWSDVSADVTPNLWRLVGESATAAVSVRTAQSTNCPADAWLTLNTGVRSAAPRGEDGRCLGAGEVLSSRGIVSAPRWADIEALGAGSSYNPEFGLLTANAYRRGCALAVGPGAGLALADAQGRVARYAARLETADLTACPLTVVDLGNLPAAADPARGQALRRLDAAIGQVTTSASAAEVLLVGMGNEPVPHLQALVAHGGDYRTGWLDANSTRHPGLVQLTDVTPTVLAGLGVATPERAVGSVLRAAPGAPQDRPALVRALGHFDRAAQTIDRHIVAFYWLVAGGAVLSSGLLIAFRRPLWLILITASLPVASFLANLLQWWRSSSPGLGLWAGVIGWAAAVGTLARLGPWRRQRFGPAGFVAAVTAIVLAADVLTGSRLQLSSLWGLSPLDAGRFYGFGNVAFGAFAIGVLIASVWIGNLLIQRGHRRWAVLSVAAIGVVAVAVDGWPSYGADFGGVLGLVPGIAVLIAAVAGIRLRARWLVAVGAIAVVAVSGIAVVDWLRPAGSRSHLGNFVQQLLDGGAGSIFGRKVGANVHSFTDRPLLSILIAVLVVPTAVLVLRPDRLAVVKARRVFAAEPLLRAGIAACLVTAVVGMAANDSGVIVLGVCYAVAVPLLVQAWTFAPTVVAQPSTRVTARKPGP